MVVDFNLAASLNGGAGAFFEDGDVQPARCGALREREYRVLTEFAGDLGSVTAMKILS